MGVILARLLEPEIFGELAAILATLTFLLIPLSFSAAQVLVGDGGRTAGLFDRVMGMVWLIVSLKAVVLGGYIAWSISSNDWRSAGVALLAGSPMVAADWLGVIRSDLEGRGQFRPNFLVQTSGVLIHGISSIVLVSVGWEIYGLAAGGLLGFFPQLVIYLIATDRKVFPVRFDASVFREQFAVGFWLWLGQIAEGWFSRIDKMALGRFGGDVQLGYYNRAFNFGPISHMALNSLMTNATVVGLAAQTTTSGRWKLFRRTCLIVFAGGLVNWALWWWFSNPLVVWIFGPHWEGAIPSFQAFSWLSLVYAVAYMPTTLLLACQAYRVVALCRLGGLVAFGCLLTWIYFNRSMDAPHVATAFCAILFLMGLALGLCAALISNSRFGLASQSVSSEG